MQLTEAEIEFRRLNDAISYLEPKMLDLVIPSDDRSLMSAGCFHVCVEHQLAINSLYMRSYYGSAFALARVLYEAVVRGLWLRRCATVEELSSFKQGRLEKNFQRLSDEVDSKLGMKGYASFTGMKKRSWNNMNDFTHTGIKHVSRRLSLETIEANYKDSEIAGVLGIASRFGTMARLELMDLAGADQLLEEILPSLAEIISPPVSQQGNQRKGNKQ